MDTTEIKAADLRRRIAAELLPRAVEQRLAVTITSFGFKHGPPRDADLTLDVRFLPNPHYVSELRPLTGRDPRVVEYVGRDGQLATFYEKLEPLLDFLLPAYMAEGKAHLMVAIGCTGGPPPQRGHRRAPGRALRRPRRPLRRGRAPGRRQDLTPGVSPTAGRPQAPWAGPRCSAIFGCDARPGRRRTAAAPGRGLRRGRARA